MKITKRIFIYTYRFVARPLEVRALGRVFHWRVIYGIQAGAWFFGVIKGSQVEATATDVSPTGPKEAIRLREELCPSTHLPEGSEWALWCELAEGHAGLHRALIDHPGSAITWDDPVARKGAR